MPAGNVFLVNIYLQEPAYYRVIVVKYGEGTVLNTGIVNNQYPQFICPTSTEDEIYQVWVTAYSNINVTAYDGYFYNE